MPPQDGGELQATWHGYCGDVYEAHIIITACIEGRLNHISRRPQEADRERLIRSGSIIVYEEATSGIKRWTDGRNWSPSRILGNYLVYRELLNTTPAGKKPKWSNKDGTGPSTTTPATNDPERWMRGSLANKPDFKDDDTGLIKKSYSVMINGVCHHLVCYYTIGDLRRMRLVPVCRDPMLGCITPLREIYEQNTFKEPLSMDFYANATDELRSWFMPSFVLARRTDTQVARPSQGGGFETPYQGYLRTVFPGHQVYGPAQQQQLDQQQQLTPEQQLAYEHHLALQQHQVMLAAQQQTTQQQADQQQVDEQQTDQQQIDLQLPAMQYQQPAMQYQQPVLHYDPQQREAQYEQHQYQQQQAPFAQPQQMPLVTLQPNAIVHAQYLEWTQNSHNYHQEYHADDDDYQLRYGANAGSGSYS